MSINLEFIATVGKWPKEKEDEVFAALQAWAFEDEQFNRREVCVDILGGSPRNPIVRMEAYTMGPIIISRFHEWSGPAEDRLRQRIAAAGGSEVRLDFEFPDED
jgi:hypothetical protein